MQFSHFYLQLPDKIQLKQVNMYYDLQFEGTKSIMMDKTKQHEQEAPAHTASPIQEGKRKQEVGLASKTSRKPPMIHSYSKALPLKGPTTSKTISSTEDQVFEYVNLQGTFHFQATTINTLQQTLVLHGHSRIGCKLVRSKKGPQREPGNQIKGGQLYQAKKIRL